ncbi:Deoxyuridine 5'-triphosphate nucleotidohydrolase [uncultured Clostridium sp.]|nr:Deoxyuridine 5'-triphosphate nucleotidohydrolase [uncultured Clostridium sp.]
MKRIAKFEKVSKEQYLEAIEGLTGVDAVIGLDDLKLPQRMTIGSAGYDFFSPVGFTLHPGETVKFPTGVRVKMEKGWVLMCYPRSGLGFKYRLQLNNTVGIIDSDYYYAENEGHIWVKLTNDSKEGKDVKIHSGDAIIQGVFTEYGITVDDEEDGVRIGGFGSTGGMHE